MRYRAKGQQFWIYAFILVVIVALLVSCLQRRGGDDIIRSLPDPTSNSTREDIYSTTLKETLRPGQIAFDIAEQMKVAEDEVVQVRVTDDLQRDLKTGLSKNAKTQAIDVTSYLGVELTGSSFDIKPLSQQKQVLAQGRVVKWLWNVTPTEAGNQKLFLQVCAYISIKNKPEIPACLETFSRDITVAVNLSSWLEQNWKWIVENWSAVAAVLTGVSVFIMARWKWINSLLNKNTPKS